MTHRFHAGILLWSSLAALPWLFGCGDDGQAGHDAGAPDASAPDADPTLWPAQSCPGDPSCPTGEATPLEAAALVVNLTPTDLKEGPTFVDQDGDYLYSRMHDDYTDTNGNGRFDTVWISGNEFSRPAKGVHDPIEARILALRHQDITVVLVTGDFIGFFFDYLQEIRALLAPAMAAQVDLVIFTSSHNHQGPDVVGIWGSDFVHSGLDPDYLARVQQTIADRIGDAVSALEPARITYGAISVEDPDGDLSHYVSDTRDPVIINNQLNVMRFARPADDSTIATVVNFAYHPEVLGSHNNELSSDFVYYLRRAVEDGIAGMADGLGGTALYVQGTVGGQIGAGRVTAVTRDGTPLEDKTWPACQAIGEALGELALRALDPAQGAVTDDSADLAFRSRRIFARVDNFNYQAAYRLGVFNRKLYNWDPTAAIDGTNTPDVLTELVYLRIGRASLVTIPGEAHPEVFIGCYDGSCSGLWPIVSPGNPNPPNLALAPSGPYLRDILAEDGSEYQWVIGLGQDELGYLMPNFDFLLDPLSPYIMQPEGDHYEETNSLGPNAHDQIIEPLVELIRWSPTAP